jgi:hypothetical protein
MDIKGLIAYLEDLDPELTVYVKSTDSDYDYQTLMSDKIELEYVTDMDDEDGKEVRALILGTVR